MKYLLQNRKEVAITIAAFVMAVINLVRAIRSHEVTQDLIVAVLVTASTVLAWYYNMGTSEENRVHTDMMRLEKAKDDLPEDYWEHEVEYEEDWSDEDECDS